MMAYAFDLEMAQNHLNLEYDFSSNFGPFQGSRTKKVGHFRVLTRDISS